MKSFELLEHPTFERTYGYMDYYIFLKIKSLKKKKKKVWMEGCLYGIIWIVRAPYFWTNLWKYTVWIYTHIIYYNNKHLLLGDDKSNFKTAHRSF